MATKTYDELLDEFEGYNDRNRVATLIYEEKVSGDLNFDKSITIDTTLDIVNLSIDSIGLKVFWMGYYSIGDGGSNWGVIKQGTHTADGGSIFTISGDYYIEANLKGNRVSIKKFGAKMDGATDDTVTIQTALDYTKWIRIPQGDFVVGDGGLEIYSDHNIEGAGRANTRLFCTLATDTIIFNVTLAAGSYNSMYLKGIAFVSLGTNVGQSILKTPQDADGLDDKHSYYIEDIYSVGTTQYKIAFDIGDHANGYIGNFDLRGQYLASVEDSTQTQTVAVSVAGASGGIGFQMFNFKISGYRTGFKSGEGIEGFYIHDGEITNSWFGVYSDSIVSKPGAHIQNIHITANKRNILFINRRNFQIDNVQLYRSTGDSYDHTEDWGAVEINNCSRVNLSNIQVRHGDEYKSSSQRYALKISNGSYNVVANGISGGYSGGLTDFLSVTNSSGVSAYGLACETVSNNIIQVIGASTNVDIGPVAYSASTVPAVPVQIGNSSLANTVRVSRESTYIPRVQSRSIAESTADDNLYAGVNSRVQIITDTEATTAYTHSINLRAENALYGDEFSFNFTIPSAAKATFRLVNSATSSVLKAYTGAGTYYATVIYTAAGWLIKSSS